MLNAAVNLLIAQRKNVTVSGSVGNNQYSEDAFL
jgi:hypothetical protein